MYDMELRGRALTLMADGRTPSEASRQLGIPRSTLRYWRETGNTSREAPRDPHCWRCDESVTDVSFDAYVHLLGLYLGDGCLSLLRKGVYSLRVACCDAYPRLIHECGDCIQRVRPGRRVFFVQAPGCTHVTAMWKHWPCLFPQHGAGRKHTRSITLENWQVQIVERFPGLFLRGLLNADGCRITNWTEKTVRGERRRYEYPRYLFVNLSPDILNLCSWALDLVGVEHRLSKPIAISVARREAVARLDEFVGPKS
jgi:Homeodomain-like domain